MASGTWAQGGTCGLRREDGFPIVARAATQRRTFQRLAQRLAGGLFSWVGQPGFPTGQSRTPGQRDAPAKREPGLPACPRFRQGCSHRPGLRCLPTGLSRAARRLRLRRRLLPVGPAAWASRRSLSPPPRHEARLATARNWLASLVIRQAGAIGFRDGPWPAPDPRRALPPVSAPGSLVRMQLGAARVETIGISAPSRSPASPGRPRHSCQLEREQSAGPAGSLGDLGRAACPTAPTGRTRSTASMPISACRCACVGCAGALRSRAVARRDWPRRPRARLRPCRPIA